MNKGGVITKEETKQKYSLDAPCLYPKVSVINPVLQASVSREYLVYSAADIIAHSIEGYFTSSLHPKLVRMQIEANTKTVIETTEILLNNPDDYEARSEFAWAATMALNGFTYIGVDGYSYPNHMIEHAMSAVVDCAHGAGLSVIMPAWMIWHKDQNLSAYERFAKEIFNLNSAEAGIAALKTWFKKVGAPTRLSEIGIDGKILDEVIDVATNNAKAWRIDKLYTRENIATIFELAK
jgi:hypothetical protein